MARKPLKDIISDRELEMSQAAFEVMMIIRHSTLTKWTRDDLMQIHFDLSYRYAPFENRIQDNIREYRARKAAQQSSEVVPA